jgi:hypothetical protein
MAVTSSEAPAAGGDEVGRRKSPWRAVKWLGGSVIVALAGWTAVEIAQYSFDRLFRDHPPPIEEQLRSVLVEAATDGYRATTTRQLDFDGDGAMSRLIILRAFAEARRTEAFADELRIYDIDGSRLKLTFRLRPVLGGLAARTRAENPQYFALQLVDAADLDGSGTAEAVLQLAHNVDRLPEIGLSPFIDAVRPLLLLWDFERARYSVIPILSPATTGRKGPRLAREKGYASEFYRAPWPIADAHSGATFVSFAADAFEIRQSREGPLLAAAFDLTVEDVVSSRLYEVRVWRLYPDGLGAPVKHCGLVTGLVRVKRGWEGPHRAIDRVLDRPRIC